MKDINGITVYERGEQIPEVDAILEFHQKESKFGYILKENNGKLSWKTATEDDYRTAESIKLGIKKESVNISISCYNTGPMHCSAFCAGPGFCSLHYYPQGHHYYCSCS